MRHNVFHEHFSHGLHWVSKCTNSTPYCDFCYAEVFDAAGVNFLLVNIWNSVYWLIRLNWNGPCLTWIGAVGIADLCLSFARNFCKTLPVDSNHEEVIPAPSEFWLDGNVNPCVRYSIRYAQCYRMMKSRASGTPLQCHSLFPHFLEFKIQGRPGGFLLTVDAVVLNSFTQFKMVCHIFVSSNVEMTPKYTLCFCSCRF